MSEYQFFPVQYDAINDHYVTRWGRVDPTSLTPRVKRLSLRERMRIYRKARRLFLTGQHLQVSR